ncbi:MAG: hypothetical protein AB1938_16035, partial [Myxococcota bacterium]
MPIRFLAAAAISISAVAVADTFDDELQAQATEIRSKSPTMVDKSTRLDTALYENRLFTYHYSQLAHPSTDYGPAQRKKYADLLRQQVVGRACTGAALKPYIDAGVSFRYVHFGSDNRLIAEVTVAKSDCAAAASPTPTRSAGQGGRSLPPAPEPPPAQRVEPTAASTAGAAGIKAIKKNAKYADVMALLRDFPCEKRPYVTHQRHRDDGGHRVAHPPRVREVAHVWQAGGFSTSRTHGGAW